MNAADRSHVELGTLSMYRVFDQLPPLCWACSALLPNPVSADCVAVAECHRCRQKHVSFLANWLPTDEDFIRFYGRIVERLHVNFGHSFSAAVELARDYYLKFTDPIFCHSIGIPVQDDEFFWHQGGDMVNRIHYYLALRANPDPARYVEWRQQRHHQTPMSRELNAPDPKGRKG
jgi:hypothetical protein